MGNLDTQQQGLDRFIQRVRREPALGREEEHALAVRARAGDERARDRLLAANLRHVVAIAVRYRRYGVPLADLISEGNVGLCIALSKFDPDHGTRFVTYAGHWIRARIIDHVLRSRTLVGGGAGVLRSKTYFRLQRERARLDVMAIEPSERRTRLAEAFGTSEEQVDEMLNRLDARDVSLDAPFGPDDGAPAIDGLASSLPEADEELSERMRAQDLERSVQHALASLDPRELRIVVARGLSDDGMSLADVAREFGVSRERARQLEARAHGKLRRELGRFVDAAA